MVYSICMENVKIAMVAPSLLSADFSYLGEEVKKVTEAGANLIHFDVMDGHFVPNITFGPMILKAIRNYTHLPFEAHLMITHPQKYWKNFADAGADIIGIHIESEINHSELIEEIKNYGKKVCLVINPPTSVEKIHPYLDKIHEILVMTVNPGFGGQNFIHEVVPKIENLVNFKEKRNLSFLIEVDGGINTDTSKIAKDAGANILVAGSFIFGSTDYKKAIEELR